LTLTFRHVDRSAALEAHARDVASRLQRIEELISRCHVTMESVASARPAGPAYVVKIELSVPGAQIHADSLRTDGSSHASLSQAMREAYDNARRQLHHLRSDRAKPP
jgi:ribosome-associated translation inhibitor RaiA